jgi:hypothetical protein
MYWIKPAYLDMNCSKTEEETRMKANRKLNDEDLEQFMSRYAGLIQYIPQIKDGR